MATELGSAFISVGLGTNTLSGDIKKAFGGAESSGRSAGAGAGKGFLSGFKGLVGAGAALVATGAFAGFISEAARASDATDKFKATMDFAGLDTKAIDAATTAAKAYADQTVYDLPTIQNTLAQLASNGVKDYTGLTKAAGNLNAVAGGNADTFKSVAMVMTQTAGAGKLTTENWNQLADAIPGAAGPLMKALEGAGAYTGNFRDAMAKGQITSEEFNTALSKLGNDPVAVEAAKSTKTFEGAIGNLEATINSGLMSALDAIKPAVTGAISGLASGIGIVNGAIGGIFTLLKTGDFDGGIRKALGLEEDSKIVGSILEIRGGFIAMFAAFQAGGNDVTSSGLAGFMERIGLAAREVTGGVQAMFAAFVAGDGDITSSGFAGFMEQIGGTARQLYDTLAPAVAALLPQIVSLWGAFSPLQVIFAAIQPLLPQLAAMFGQLASTIGGTLGAVLTGILPMIMQLSALISQSLGSVLAAVLPAAVQMITMLGATMSQLLPIIMPIIGTIAQLATTLISQLAPIITNLVTAILPPVVSIFGNILSVIGPLISMIAGLLIPIIQALMPVVVTVFGVIAAVITSAMQIIQGIIQVVTGIITGNWSMVWEGIGNILAGVWNTIVAVVGGAMASLWSAIQAGFKLVTDFFGGIGDTIMGALSGAGKWLWDAGVNIVQGLFDGIKSLAGTIGNFFLGLLPGWIVEPFKLALGIHSPSRVFAGLGENIGQGLLNGVDGMQGKIDGTMSNLVTVPPVPKFGSPSFSPTSAGASTGAAGGGAGVNVNIHPAPGMSEETIGRVAAHSLDYKLRMAGA